MPAHPDVEKENTHLRAILLALVLRSDGKLFISEAEWKKMPQPRDVGLHLDYKKGEGITITRFDVDEQPDCRDN